MSIQPRRVVKVPLHANPHKVAEIDANATEGAIVGVNLRRKDGSLVTDDDLGGGQAAQALSRAAADAALAQARRALQTLRGDIDTAIGEAEANVQRIRSEILASVGALETQIDGIEDAIFRVDTQNPGIVQTLQGIKFDIEDADGFIATSLRADTSVLGSIILQRLDGLKVEVEGFAEGLVADEALARVTADGILTRRANVTDALLCVVPPTDPENPATARSLALEAIEQDLQQTASGVTAQGLRISSLETSVNHPGTGLAATASGLNSLTTRVTSAEGAINAQATQISTVAAAVGEVEADVSELTQVVVGPAGPGQNPPILARRALRVNANGHVIGMVFENNGQTGSVTFVADTFQITSPSLTNPVTPFAVLPDPDNGNAPTVYITDAKIQNLTVDQINGGSIRDLWNLDNANGQIRIGSGANVKIIGAGFGTSNQFIEWFGPAAGPINEANAISYVKTDGSVFFAGSISAGVIFNSQQTNSVAPNASVSLSHISQGRVVTVTVSYLCQISGTRTQPQASPGNPSAMLSINVAGTDYMLPVFGSYSGFGDPGELYYFTSDMAGSATFTIPAGPAGVRNVTASVIARQISGPRGDSFFADSFTQNITITSSES